MSKILGIVAITLVLNGCIQTPVPKRYVYRTLICPKHGNACQTGGVLFPTLNDCERLVERLKQLQPDVGRVCVLDY